MSDDPRLDVLRPTPDEVAAVRDPLPRAAARQLSAWTAPSAAEIARLQARAPRHARAARPLRSGWGGLALAAAVLLLLTRAPQPADPPATLAISADPALVLPTGPLHLNPDIQAEGDGDLHILTASTEGARVEVREGAITFEVDPRGVGRDLVVVAGDVEVRVTGTRFTVSRHGTKVRVSVARGAVQVRYPDGQLALRAGETWELPAPVAVLRAPPVPPTAPAPPVPEPPPEETPRTVVPLRAGQGVELFVALLDAEEAGRPPEELLVLCDAFLSAYGAVPMREEVEVRRLQQLWVLRPAEVVLPEAEAWLAAHPASPHRSEVLLMVGDMQAEVRGDCAEGLPYYRAVIAEAASPPQQERARSRIAGCEGAP